jgi:hypothetical protein
MPERTFSLFDFLRLSATNIPSDYRAAIRVGELSETFLEIPKFRILQFLGTYRGFKREGPISEKLYQRFYYPDRVSFPPSDATEGDAEPVEARKEANEIEYPDEDDRLHVSSDD